MATAEKPSHVYVVFIETTPERIWDALTKSEFTEQYYFASTVESDWTEGSALRVPDPGTAGDHREGAGMPSLPRASR